jgi:translation elongation factor EF-Tu-like GTPase
MLYKHDEFEARIRIFSAQEGGRRGSTFNGIRWDFVYADAPSDNLYMIYPDFCDEDGASMPTDVPLAVGPVLRARMFGSVDVMRAEVHRHRIVPGIKFYCVEGPRRVAEGVVTQITGLFRERPEA